MNWLKSKKTIAVHDGSFHPDDVFSVALLSIFFNGRIKVIRTRDEKKYSKADFVVDIGLVYDPTKNKFDHHQEGGAGFRDNKIMYSSFGLLWKEYGEKICGKKNIADIIDRKIVTLVDADDCGINLCQEVIPGIQPVTLMDLIYSIKPTWKEDQSKTDLNFIKAVDLAREVLLREIAIARDNLEAEGLMDEVYNNSNNKKIIILDKIYLPIVLLHKYPEPLFMVYKDKKGYGWRVITIRKNEQTYEPRKNFPEIWWGKTDEVLAGVSGVSDSTFCRNGGIYAGTKSKEGAIKLAELALSEVANLSTKLETSK
jgi:uncharacterized UPF0160 family protein